MNGLKLEENQKIAVRTVTGTIEQKYWDDDLHPTRDENDKYIENTIYFDTVDKFRSWMLDELKDKKFKWHSNDSFSLSTIKNTSFAFSFCPDESNGLSVDHIIRDLDGKRRFIYKSTRWYYISIVTTEPISNLDLILLHPAFEDSPDVTVSNMQDWLRIADEMDFGYFKKVVYIECMKQWQNQHKSIDRLTAFVMATNINEYIERGCFISSDKVIQYFIFNVMMTLDLRNMIDNRD